MYQDGMIILMVLFFRFSAKEGQLQCTTSASRGSGELGIIGVEMPNGAMYYSKPDVFFTYKPDPIITSLGRMSGIAR